MPDWLTYILNGHIILVAVAVVVYVAKTEIRLHKQMKRHNQLMDAFDKANPELNILDKSN